MMQRVARNKTFTDLFGDNANNAVVLGGGDDPKRFHAHANLGFWGENKIHFSMPGVMGDPSFNMGTGAITLEPGGGRRLRFWHHRAKLHYHKGNEAQSQLKWEVGFLGKPSSNEYRFTLGADFKDFGFHYQTPFANPTRILGPDGTPWLSEVQGMGEAQRPEIVDGSYAVYHKTKRDHCQGRTNYRTGKVLHIYRPVARDAAGRTCLVDLHIEGDQYVATVPAAFLDRAQYPVFINDTFGYTSVGGSTGYVDGSNYLNTNPPTAPAGDGTLSAVVWYVVALSGTVNSVHGLYAQATSAPGDLLDQCSAVTVTETWGWYSGTSTGTPNLTSGTNYYIALTQSAMCLCRYDGGGQRPYKGHLYTGSLPATFGTPDGTVYNWLSGYATYTPAAVPLEVIVADTLAAGDAQALGLGAVQADGIKAGDAQALGLGAVQADGLAAADAAGVGMGAVLLDALAAADAHAAAMAATLLDAVAVPDQAASTIGAVLADALGLSDAVAGQMAAVLLDQLSAADAAQFAIAAVLTDRIGIVDVAEYAIAMTLVDGVAAGDTATALIRALIAALEARLASTVYEARWATTKFEAALAEFCQARACSTKFEARPATTCYEATRP